MSAFGVNGISNIFITEFQLIEIFASLSVLIWKLPKLIAISISGIASSVSSFS